MKVQDPLKLAEPTEHRKVVREPTFCSCRDPIFHEREPRGSRSPTARHERSAPRFFLAMRRKVVPMRRSFPTFDQKSRAASYTSFQRGPSSGSGGGGSKAGTSRPPKRGT